MSSRPAGREPSGTPTLRALMASTSLIGITVPKPVAPSRF